MDECLPVDVLPWRNVGQKNQYGKNLSKISVLQLMHAFAFVTKKNIEISFAEVKIVAWHIVGPISLIVAVALASVADKFKFTPSRPSHEGPHLNKLPNSKSSADIRSIELVTILRRVKKRKKWATTGTSDAEDFSSVMSIRGIDVGCLSALPSTDNHIMLTLGQTQVS